MPYSQTYEITSHDPGMNGIVKPGAVWRYLQETANRQLRDERPSYDELFDSGRAYILSRMNVVCRAPLRAYDIIRVDTWACSESHGASHDRCYQMFRGNELVSEGYGVWALVNLCDRSFITLAESGLHYTSGPAIELPLPKRVRLPRGLELRELGVRKVAYTDVDRNAHMNNTHYPDVLCDTIDGFEKLFVTAISINYVHEAPLGSVIRVTGGQTPSEDGQTDHWFRTFVGDEVNVEAMIRTAFI